MSIPWNLQDIFLNKIKEKGGYVCHHAHLDKAYLINEQNLVLSQRDMQEKWKLYRDLKKNYTEEDLYERISRGVDGLLAQGVTHCRSFIDADSLVGLLPLQVARKVQEDYKGRIHLEFAVQPLEGVLDPETRQIYIKACELADVVGGLPSRDRPYPEKHLEFILSLAKDLNKPVDVHVDQENNPLEHETEMLARATIKQGMEGQVRAVHAISLAAQPLQEQDRVIGLLKDAGMGVIICPSAALSMKPVEGLAPIHNSIAPLQKLIHAEIPVGLGVDNIHDLFMPLVDGDLWFECRLLMEATRCYDLEIVATCATSKFGFNS